MNFPLNHTSLNGATSNAAHILSSKAMLANLSITQWTARKLDKRVTAKTNNDHGAAYNAGNYNKALIAGDALSKIVTASNAARGIHYELTLPWLDSGARILPAAAYAEYANRMRKCKEDFQAAVAEFVGNYPQYVDDSRRRLGDMYNAGDYPAASLIAGKFTFGTAIYQVPASDDFRVQISDDEATAIRAQIEARTHDALDAAMKDAWGRIAETVGHMAAKLGEFKPASDGIKASGVFRDSLVDNVKGLVRILPALNITGNPALATIAARMQAELCQYGADDLRESDVIRAKVKDSAAAIVASVSDFM